MSRLAGMSELAPGTDVRGLFMGSGAGLAEPGMAELVVELHGTTAASLELLYVGTATYDRVEPRARQCRRFAEIGCGVTSLDVATGAPTRSALEDAIGRAGATLVSGGNTLYAVDRWVALGIDDLLRRAIERGAVVCGGSAGAICWFDGGHSDPMDPTSYREPIADDDPGAGDWRYLRVDGLGVLLGLLCPHYEATQSNGVPRALDFAHMLRRHPGETGLGLDSWAGLLVDGERFRVVAPDGHPGSVGAGEFVDDGSGRPGLWVIESDGSETRRRLAPPVGTLSDIARPARSLVADPLLQTARAENPLPAA